jgi:transcriptional regulator with XRE-family HTH domain
MDPAHTVAWCIMDIPDRYEPNKGLVHMFAKWLLFYHFIASCQGQIRQSVKYSVEFSSSGCILGKEASMVTDDIHLKGARICALREVRNLEPGVLAYKAGVSTAHIYRLESDRRPNASAVVVGKIADALDTTVEYLIGLTDDPSPLRPSTLELDPKRAIRLQAITHRLACLPSEAQERVVEAVALMIEAAEIAQERTYPE